MAAVARNPLKVAEIMKAGAIPAIPRKGETGAEAEKRVQAKHPGKVVKDPPNPGNAQANGGGAGKPMHRMLIGNVMRQAQTKTRDIYRAGYERLPVPKTFQFDGYYNEFSYSPKAMGSIPSDWCEPVEKLRYKVDRAEVHREFQLYATRKNKIDETIQVGRTWTPYFEGDFNVINGHVWGDIELTLEPAFSGLEEEAMEKTAFAALANLPHSFANSRQADFTAQSRYALRDLINREFNAVRFLWRLAVMYLGTRIVEARGDNLIVNAVDDAPKIIFIKTVGQYSQVLTAAAEGNAQVIYTELNRMSVDVALLEVYYAAASGTPYFQVRGGGETPSILKAWPEIPNTLLGVYGRVDVAVRVGAIDSQTVWTAIEHYVRMYGLQDVAAEVFDNLQMFTMRPRGDTVLCGHQAIEFALPESNMAAAGVGPLAGQVRNWEKTLRALREPNLFDYLWNSTTRYGAWALAYRDVCAQIGGQNVLLPVKLEREQLLHGELIASSAGAVNALQMLVEQYMNNYGWENALGRVITSVRGLSKINTQFNGPSSIAVALTSKFTVQWEEFAPQTKNMPDTAFASSLLYPAAPAEMLPKNRWLVASSVANRPSDVYAYNSMAALGMTKFAYQIYDRYSQSFRRAPLQVYRNYRDGISDSQFATVSLDDGTIVTPTFKYATQLEALNALLLARRAVERDWFVDSAISETVDGLITFFKEFDRQEKELHDIDLGMGDRAPDEAPEDRPLLDMQDQRVETVVHKRYHGEGQEEELPQMSYQQKEETKKMGPKPWEVRREEILKLAGEGAQIPWLDKITDIRNRTGPNDVTVQERNRTDGQLALQSLREVDIRLIPCFMTNQVESGRMMRLISNALDDLIPHVPAGSCQVDVYRMAQAARLQGAVLSQTDGIIDSTSYQVLTGRALPEHVPAPLFDDAIMAGLMPGEIINTQDAKHLQRLIDRQAQVIEDSVAEWMRDRKFGVAPDEVGEFTGHEPSKASDEPGPSGVPPGEPGDMPPEKPDVGIEPAVAGEPIKQELLATAEAVATLNVIPEEVKVSDFGGEASQLGTGDTSQQQPEQPATGVEATPQQQSSGVAFTSRPLPEQ